MLWVIASFIILLLSLFAFVVLKTLASPSKRYAAIHEITNIDSFNHLMIQGLWDVTLIQSDNWRLVFDEDLSSVRGMNISVRDNTLALMQLRRFKLDKEVKVTVYMPKLSSINASGKSEIQISGFSGEALEIDASGAMAFIAQDSRYKTLNLIGAGAVNLDLKGLSCTDAHVELSGATKLRIAIDGGSLTGSISGASDIDYYGQANTRDVNVSGISVITQHPM